METTKFIGSWETVTRLGYSFDKWNEVYAEREIEKPIVYDYRNVSTEEDNDIWEITIKFDNIIDIWYSGIMAERWHL